MSSFFSYGNIAAGKDLPASGVKIFYAAGILLSGVLMVCAARGDLWLDEIWSILFAEAAKTPWEIVSVFKHDNNHILNTLYLYLLGKQQQLMLYRAFAIASGIGALVLLVKIASRRGRLESVFALILAGTSYPLILYFSEARGYAPAVFFGLLAFYVIQEIHVRYSPAKLVLFWFASALGVLAHVTFIIVFLALAVYIVHHEFSAEGSLLGKSRQAFKYLMVPGIFVMAFYFAFIRSVAIGGGPRVDLYFELGRGVVCLLGLPDAFRNAGLPIIALLLSLAVFVLARDRKPVWSFYLSVLVIAPASIMTITNPRYFHFRYLIVCFPFYYLVLSFMLAKAWRADKKVLRYLAALILCLYVAGQSTRLWPLFQYGRGNYQAVVREMADATASDVITVGSDNDFRNKMVLSFYARFLQGGKTIQYIGQESWGKEPPEWLILHSLDESAEPEPWIETETGRPYWLVKAEKFSGNSGFSWFLYHDRNK